MDDTLRTQYENYFKTFRTEGWKHFIEDMQTIYDGYHIEDIKDSEQLAFTKGERRILNQILCFEDNMQAHYKLLLEDLDV